MRILVSVVAAIFLVSTGLQALANGFFEITKLSERERTFLRYVFAGDESNAVAFAQAANINVNAIAGHPLSTWFYRLGRIDNTGSKYRDLTVQKIVFGTFKQPPNPTDVVDTNLGDFCGDVPVLHIPTEMLNARYYGSPQQFAQLVRENAQAREPAILAMARGFQSLINYGLRNKWLINQIFKGCLFQAAAPVDAHFYDTVLEPMVRAGADVNLDDDKYDPKPILHAVATLNADLVEKLIADHARTNTTFGHGPDPKRCAPVRDLALYNHVFRWTRPHPGAETETLMRIVKALASTGVLPTTAYGVQDSSAPGGCRFESFADAVLDTGNIALANSLKAVGESARAMSGTPTVAPPVSSEKQAAVPASPSASQNSKVASLPPSQASQPIASASFGAQKVGRLPDGKPAAGDAALVTPSSAQNAPEPGTQTFKYPLHIGDWEIAPWSQGLTAVAKAQHTQGDQLAGLLFQCVSGHLDYVPIALKLNGWIRSLWITSFDDNIQEMRLVKDRASGAKAVTLSKMFAALEESAIRQGFGDKFTVEMNVDGPTKDMVEMKMAGFSKMRSYMLANCSTKTPAQQAALSPTDKPRAMSDSIAGAPTVVSTSAIVIGGQAVALQGVDGLSGSHADKLRAFLREQGGQITCARANDQSYRCKTASNVDLSAAIIFNGSGRALADAPDDLKRAEQSARQRKVGLWATGQ